ncbi:carboxypeptidase-like regulatory domain-containing protein [Pontibacter burrus]|uniref:Carboxypeptidase-like regulatory domain-containing protein n=1 Tax=Pontibacter burrus TaxID=2704466 RepID=A0A6B3LY41_9BACT|nr:carboxypeptidase-like regulatory domain-containing protein [Pontibacter burrus]NEM98354.1 hypothetical protein [Pontibacter burrus]
MIRILLLFSALFFSCAAQAQVKITGDVSDTAGIAVEGVSVVVLTQHDNLTLAFGLTDQNGVFSIEVDVAIDSLKVVAQALGYGRQQFVIGNTSQRLRFTLANQSLELREVTVKASPITSSNDTVSYLVTAFTDIKDRSIADVLRKMPGIEVEGNGRILYEGKPIQKFYIEGLDLLEGRYNLASNNLPAADVTSVQILENHQPIRILDSLVTSFSPSLNIKLKNNITTTGTAKVGTGVPFALWDANLTPMLFTRKHQLLASYQTNNAGHDVSTDLKTLTAEDLREQAEWGVSQGELLRLRELSPPRFSGERYLLNNAHLVSANYLRKISKDMQVRVSASYLNDYQRQVGETRSIFFTPGDTVTLRETKNNKLYTNAAEAGVTMYRNTADKFLENRLRLKGSWDSKWGSILSSGNSLRQDLVNPSYSAANRLRVIQPFGKQLIEFSSVVSLDIMRQQLNIEPGQFGGLMAERQQVDEMEQQLQSLAFHTYNTASLTKALDNWTLNQKVGVQLEHQELGSNLLSILYGEEPRQKSLAVNKLGWQRMRYFIESEAEYKTARWSINARLPVNYRVFEFGHIPHLSGNRLNGVTAEPGIAGRFNLTPMWKATASFRMTNHYGTLDQFTSAYLLRDYRTLQLYDAPLQERQTRNYMLGLAYRNALKSLFTNLTYTYSSSESNLLYQNSLNEDGSLVVSGIEQRNPMEYHSLAWQGSKYFSELRTTLKLGSNFYVSNRKQLLNDRLVDVAHRYYSVRTEVNAKLFEWLSVNYIANLSLLDGVVGQKNMGEVYQQDYILDLSFYPVENHYFGLKTDAYVTSGADNGTPKYYFTDAVYRFSFGKRKIDTELRWTNIFNTSEFIHVYTDGFARVENLYRLRPSQLMVSLKFAL